VKIHILSDLHQEFAEYSPAPVKADVIILAGDTHKGLNGVRWAKQTFTHTPVIYIAGNHEYYGKNFKANLQRMREETKGTNVHFLENDSIKIGDVTFLGTTLWTDLNFHGNRPVAETDIVRAMNDYKAIRIEPLYRKLLPRDTAGMFDIATAWLTKTLPTIAGKKVVITHHGISHQSVPEEFKGDSCQPAYTSELTPFILDNPVNLWIHGHTHKAFDYTIGTTRVVTNPRGYPSETNHGFNPNLVIDL
jgi:predicted phosphodiesterase